MENAVITSIRLINEEEGIPDLWALNGQFTPEFAAGFVYGVIYGLDKLGNTSWYLQVFIDLVIDGEEIEGLFVYEDVNDLFNRFGPLAMFYGMYLLVGAPLQRLRLYDVKPDKYVFLLRHKTNGVDASGNEDFLRGLFSALDAFNIPRGEVLLTRPYKQGVFHDVNGMQLETPQ